MGRQKKPKNVQSADALEVKRLREGLNREAQACRAKASALIEARSELERASAMGTQQCIAFLNGEIRILLCTAAMLDDLRCGSDVPF
jgi:hypothetical protein